MNRYITLHGHFYQPPRENPWLEEVELQDTAYPYHDWNERITTECYAPNSAAQILDSEGYVDDLVNNYSRMSFNFGSTLLMWMKRHEADIYRSIIEADRESRDRFSGHGSCLAQAYNHLIMPLANSRDKRTQVIWGVRDFEYRFGRKPEGMWLPETAVDLETLDIMAWEGILFTILAPHQGARIKKLGEKEAKWKSVENGSIDPRYAYRCELPSGRNIAIFFYDGPISHDIAFGGLLRDGKAFAERLRSSFVESREGPQLVHVATDGETYGHHQQHGDMGLAYCLNYLMERDDINLTNYGEFLERHPPGFEVEIVENTSWSCAHGVERWRKDCGCSTGKGNGWTQAWRAPLRGALDWLLENLAEVYEAEMSRLCPDPWKTRDDFIDVILDRSIENTDRFIREHAARELEAGEKTTFLMLQELQRHAMLMYTSCGWFFDEISGLETTQVMRYAARAMQLAEEVSGVSLEGAFIGLLERAPSNIRKYETGKAVYENLIQPEALDLQRVALHYGMSSLFRDYSESERIYTYRALTHEYDRSVSGRRKIALGAVSIRSDITWEEKLISFAALHLGGHDVIGDARDFAGEEAFEKMQLELKENFVRGNISELIRLIDLHFSLHRYSLWHLFKDEQRRIFDHLLEDPAAEAEHALRQIYEDHYPIMQAVHDMNVPIPDYFSLALRVITRADILEALESDPVDLTSLQNAIDTVHAWSLDIDRVTLGFRFGRRLNSLVEGWNDEIDNVERLETILSLLQASESLSLSLNLWRAQCILFTIARDRFEEMQTLKSEGSDSARRWINLVNQLSTHLKVRIT